MKTSYRPSYHQTKRLTEFLEEHPEIASGKHRTAQAKCETKKKWQSWASTLNAMGNAVKDGKGWAKYWAEKKCALKKTYAQQCATQVLTGKKVKYSCPLDRRLIAVMDGSDPIQNNNFKMKEHPDLHLTSSQEEQLEEVPGVIVEEVEVEEVVATSPTTTSPGLSPEESPMLVIRVRNEKQLHTLYDNIKKKAGKGLSVEDFEMYKAATVMDGTTSESNHFEPHSNEVYCSSPHNQSEAEHLKVQTPNSIPEVASTSITVESVTRSPSPFEDTPKTKKKKMMNSLCESILKRKTEKHINEDKIFQKQLEVLEIQKQQELVKLQCTKKLFGLDIELKRVQLESARFDLECKKRNSHF